jgi:ATP-dependent protease ClpP protease subunit
MRFFVVFLMAILLCLTVEAKTIVLTPENTVVLDDVISDETVPKVTQQLMEKSGKLQNSDPLYLVLNSPGGSISDGLNLIEAIKALNRPVDTVTLFSASMAFQTVQGVAGNRYITEFGTLMSHKAKGGFSGEFPGQLDSRYSLWLKRIDAMDKATVERTKGKQTLQSYRALYENEMWMDGKESVAQGFADEVVVVKCHESLNTSKTTTYDFSMFGFKVIAETSNCPLIQGFLSLSVVVAYDGKWTPLQAAIADGYKMNLQDCDYNGRCSVTNQLNEEKINKEIERIKNKKISRDVIKGY